jgi:hypothetical protein
MLGLVIRLLAVLVYLLAALAHRLLLIAARPCASIEPEAEPLLRTSTVRSGPITMIPAGSPPPAVRRQRRCYRPPRIRDGVRLTEKPN